MDYTIYCTSNRPHLYEELVQSISPEKVIYFDGSEYSGRYDLLLNDCIAQCPTETILIASDKVRPTALDVQKILILLEQGYGVVGLRNLAFFASKKQLYRQIGLYDDVGWTDLDFILRLKEANIACYITEEVERVALQTTWDYDIARDKMRNKWNLKNYKRLRDEPKYSYDLDKSIHTRFLPWHFSRINSRVLMSSPIKGALNY